MTDSSIFDTPLIRYIAYAIAILLLAIAQLLVSPLIAFENIYPNFLLIFTVAVALREGQLVGLGAAFLAGLTYDVIGNVLLGVNAMASILAVFLAGYFYREGRFRQTVGSYKFPIVIALSAFVYNLVYHILLIEPTELDFMALFTTYGIASTLYTTVISVIPMLIVARKSQY